MDRDTCRGTTSHLRKDSEAEANRSAKHRFSAKANSAHRRRCILYIVRRTQLYLDEDLWRLLHVRARKEKTTVSDLVRRAVRDRYQNGKEERRAAMESVIGLWKDRDDLPETESFIRELRGDDRLERLYGK